MSTQTSAPAPAATGERSLLLRLYLSRGVLALAWALAAATLMAGIGFLLVPAQAAFPPQGDLGVWEKPVRLAKWVALENNLVPSLHVALTVVCVAVYAARAPVAGKVLLWLWALGVGASTLLLHQHYLLDVATGFAVGLAGYAFVYRPRAEAGAGMGRKDVA